MSHTPYKQIANSPFLNPLRWSSHVRSSSPFWMPAVYYSSKQTSATLITYFVSDKRESCSSREQSTWQDERQEAGMRMRPRHRCSMGEGKERWVLRYSTASWRMMFPCLSMQWNAPTKKRPSLTPTNIRRNSIFRTWLTNGELFGSELTGIVGGLDWCGLWCWGTKEDSADTSMSIELECLLPVQIMWLLELAKCWRYQTEDAVCQVTQINGYNHMNWFAATVRGVDG